MSTCFVNASLKDKRRNHWYFPCAIPCCPWKGKCPSHDQNYGFASFLKIFIFTQLSRIISMQFIAQKVWFLANNLDNRVSTGWQIYKIKEWLNKIINNANLTAIPNGWSRASMPKLLAYLQVKDEWLSFMEIWSKWKHLFKIKQKLLRQSHANANFLINYNEFKSFKWT